MPQYLVLKLSDLTGTFSVFKVKDVFVESVSADLYKVLHLHQEQIRQISAASAAFLFTRNARKGCNAEYAPFCMHLFLEVTLPTRTIS